MAKLDSKLTDTVARALPAPTEKDQEIYWCAIDPGFGLRITRTGRRSFVVEMRLAGETVRRTLGAMSGFGRGGITSEAARKIAERLRVELRDGKDRLTDARVERAERKAAVPLADALQAFVSDPTGNRGVGLKQRTRDEYLAMLRPPLVKESGFVRQAGELHAIADVPLDRLTGARIKELFADLLKNRGKARSAYAMRVLRATLRYHGVRMVDDPFATTTARKNRVTLPKIGAKVRALEPDQLATWWAAAGKTTSGDFLRLLLLTGCRRGELSAVLAGDVDLERGRLRLTDTKNRKPHTVYLSRQALAIVAARMQGKGTADSVFERTRDPRKSIQSIINETGIAFSPHDLRRTFALLTAARLPGYVVKKLLGHSPAGDVTAEHYVGGIDEGTLRAAWQLVADVIDPPPVVPAKDAAKVVPIAKARKARRSA